MKPVPPAASKAATSERAIRRMMSAFEKAALFQEDGTEFWLARDLAYLLRYQDIRNFLLVVEKAKTACKNSGIPPENHFVDVTEMVLVGSGARRAIEDVKLSRYACYLVAQNADARKQPVAFAQTYFAVQTQLQENGERPIHADLQRVRLRREISTHNKRLASAAKTAGVIQPLDYAVFQNAGYKGLYGGLDRMGIQAHRGLLKTANILDHMGSTELAANLFRATQAEEKLRREGIQGKDAANRAHFDVGKKVRQTIGELGGDMPEDLPVEENIKTVERRLARKAVPPKRDKTSG